MLLLTLSWKNFFILFHFWSFLNNTRKSYGKIPPPMEISFKQLNPFENLTRIITRNMSTRKKLNR